MRFRCFFFLSRRLLFDFLYLLSSENQIRSMISPEMMGLTPDPIVRILFALSLRFDDYVGSDIILGSDVFVPTVFKSKSDILHLMCLYQQESSPKVVNLSKNIHAQIHYFLSKFETRFYSYSRSHTLPHLLQPL